MAQKSPGQLQEHMLGTYHSLRLGLAVIGFALPLVVLLAGGFLHDVWFEGSISMYYHTKAVISYLVARDLFVGGLFATAACLYLYKGFSTRENLVLNAAAVFATLVAVMPTAPKDTARDWVAYLHVAAALSFFGCIAFVSLFHSRDTLELVPPEKRSFFEKWYVISGSAMVLFPVIAVVLSFWLETRLGKTVIIYVAETLGVWAFCAYWGIKSYEMRVSAVDQRALDRELERRAVHSPGTSDKAAMPGANVTQKVVERIVAAPRPS